MTEFLGRMDETIDSFYAFTSNNIVFWTVFIFICIKSVILVGFLANTDPSDFDIIRGLESIPSLAVYFSFIAGTLAFAFLFEGKKRIGFLIGFDILISLLYITDLMNYRSYASFISPYMLEQAGNLENLGSSIISMIRKPDIVFLLDIPVLCLLIYFSRHRIEHIKRNISFFILVLLLSLGIMFYVQSETNGDNPSLKAIFQVSWLPSQTFTNLSPIGYHLFDSYMFFYETRTAELEPKEKNEIRQWLVSKAENLPDNQYKGMFAGKNIIVIQVESLENFVINQKIDGQEITPNLNRILANSIYFPMFVQQVNGGLSSDADLLTNTSVYPVRKGATFFRYPDNTYNSLPLLLENIGYSTVAIHPDRGSYWNWKPALESIGFQRCLDSSSWNIEETINLGISDGCYLPQVEKKILEQKAPFYAFVVTLTSHAPFDLPDKYKELKMPAYLDETRLGGYFHAVHYTDKQLGLFLESLDKDKLLDNTVVVIYGDHQGVHTFYNDEVQQIEPAQPWWRDNYHRVPMIIYQKQAKGETVQVIGGQVDTLPTLAYLMGVDEKNYINTAMGRNLLKTNKSFAVTSSGIFYGDADNKKLQEHSLKGLDIADTIIRSNYFKNE